MRLALLSDIHGNLAALEAVVDDLRRQGVDQVVNLGDSLSGPLLPQATARFLMAQDWPTLAGNHERQLLAGDGSPMGASDAYARSQLSTEALHWIAGLAHRLQLTADVLLCHGTPERDDAYFLESVDARGIHLASAAEIDARLAGETAALVACGHTHLPRAVRSRGGTLVVNPGSVGLPAYAHDVPAPHVVENGSPDARYAIVEQVGRSWHVGLRSVPYDHAAMARLARQRGRPDWERALLTGHMA